MGPALVVVHLEVRQQFAQVIQAPDERHPRQPFPLECPDQPLRDRDGAMLAHRAEALLDISVPQQRPHHQ